MSLNYGCYMCASTGMSFEFRNPFNQIIKLRENMQQLLKGCRVTTVASSLTHLTLVWQEGNVNLFHRFYEFTASLLAEFVEQFNETNKKNKSKNPNKILPVLYCTAFLHFNCGSRNKDPPESPST